MPFSIFMQSFVLIGFSIIIGQGVVPVAAVSAVVVPQYLQHYWDLQNIPLYAHNKK